MQEKRVPDDSAAPLRIGIVTDAYLPGVGGIENHTINLAAELQRLGHDVTVITHQIPEDLALVAGQVASPVPVRRMPGIILVYRDHDVALSPTMFLSFGRLLRERRFDIIHGQSEGSILVYGALALARLRGLPTVLTRHSVLSVKAWFARPFVKLPVSVFSRFACGLIAVSNACARERLGFPGPVRVIPNGVDVDALRPDPVARERVRAEFGFGRDEVVVGFVGRLHTSKGIPMLVSAFERLRRPGLRLLLAGPGPLRPMIERSPAFKAGAITLLPAQPYDRVASVLSALDVFAFPCGREAFGISLLEAMACGLPSVAVGRWGVLDLAVGGETGFLVRDESEFGARLTELVADAGLRARMGAAARRRATELFSWRRVAADTVSYYRELIGR